MKDKLTWRHLYSGFRLTGDWSFRINPDRLYEHLTAPGGFVVTPFHQMEKPNGDTDFTLRGPDEARIVIVSEVDRVELANAPETIPIRIRWHTLLPGCRRRVCVGELGLFSISIEITLSLSEFLDGQVPETYLALWKMWEDF